MNSTPAPGLRHQSTARTLLRVLGVVLVVGGAYLAVTGWRAMDAVMDDFSMESDGETGAILRLAGGMFMVVFGLGALNAGFLGAQSRYAAGEVVPAVKDAAAYLSDGQGMMGAGRTVDDRRQAADGPYCRGCGVRNDEDAKFCDSCGGSLA